MGAGKIAAERLFEDHAPPRAVFSRQTRLAEMATDRSKARGWRRQIKQPVAPRGAFALDAAKFALDFSIGRIIVRVALDIGDAAENLIEHVLIDRPAGELRQAFGEILAKGVARGWTAGDTHESELLVQQTRGGKIVKRGHEQPVRECAGRPEDDKAAGIGGSRRGGAGLDRHDGLALRSLRP